MVSHGGQYGTFAVENWHTEPRPSVLLANSALRTCIIPRNCCSKTQDWRWYCYPQRHKCASKKIITIAEELRDGLLGPNNPDGRGNLVQFATFQLVDEVLTDTNLRKLFRRLFVQDEKICDKLMQLVYCGEMRKILANFIFTVSGGRKACKLLASFLISLLDKLDYFIERGMGPFFQGACSAISDHKLRDRIWENHYIFDPVTISEYQHLKLGTKEKLPFEKVRPGPAGAYGKVFEVEIAGGYWEGNNGHYRVERYRNVSFIQASLVSGEAMTDYQRSRCRLP